MYAGVQDRALKLYPCEERERVGYDGGGRSPVGKPPKHGENAQMRLWTG